MKLLLFCFLLAGITCSAQEKANKTFIVKTTSGVQDIQRYIDAMEKADFSCHRIRNKRRPIEFQSGVIIELLSAQEVLMGGMTPNTNCLSEESVLEKKQSVYTLTNNGNIMEIIDAPELPKKAVKK